MSKVDLSRYARFPQVFYVDDDGSTKHYPSLSWCEQDPDGTIVCDVEKIPRVATYYPPLEECDERRCYNRWLQYDFMLYPNYEIEEVGRIEIVVRRSDGVRFKLVSWLWKTILLELAKRPEGMDLFELIPIVLGWMATARPDLFKEPTDELIARESRVIVDAVGALHYEVGVIEVKRVK
jgi:hypothetical protein